MSENLHAHAQHLVAKERVEGISQDERDWLGTHFRECARCLEFASQTDHALRALRTAAIPLPGGLASRTQLRVHLRAQELREREPKRRMLWLTCAVSWIFGVASAPFVWRLFEWFGQHTGVPKLVLRLGFGLWWTIPALFAAIVLVMEKARQSDEPEGMRAGH